MSDHYPKYTNTNDYYNEMSARNDGTQFDGNDMEVPEEYRDYQEEYYYPHNTQDLNNGQKYMSQYYPQNHFENELKPQSSKRPGKNDNLGMTTSYEAYPFKNKRIHANSSNINEQAGNFIPVDQRHRNKGNVVASKSRISKEGNDRSRVHKILKTSTSSSSYERPHETRKKKSTHRERRKPRHEKELKDDIIDKMNERDSKRRRKKKREKLRRQLEEEEEKKSCQKRHSSKTKKCRASQACYQLKPLLPLKRCGLEDCCHNKYSESSCCHGNSLCGGTRTRCGIKVKPYLKQEKYNLYGVPVENLHDCHYFCKNISTPTRVMPHCISSNSTEISYPCHCDHTLAPYEPTALYQQITQPYPNVMPPPKLGVPQMVIAPPNQFQELLNVTPHNEKVLSQTPICHNLAMNHTATPGTQVVSGIPVEAKKFAYATFPKNDHMKEMNVSGSIPPSYQVVSQSPNAVYTPCSQPDPTKQPMHGPKNFATLAYPHAFPTRTITYEKRIPEGPCTYVPIIDHEHRGPTVRDTQYVVPHLPTALQQVVHSATGPEQRLVYAPFNQMPADRLTPSHPSVCVSHVDGNNLQQNPNGMLIQSHNNTKVVCCLDKQVPESSLDQRLSTVNSDWSKKFVYFENPAVHQNVSGCRDLPKNCTHVEENSCLDNQTASPRMYYNRVGESEMPSAVRHSLPVTENRNVVIKKIANVYEGESLDNTFNKKKTDYLSEEYQPPRKVVQVRPSVTHQPMVERETLYQNQGALSNCYDSHICPCEDIKFGVTKCNNGLTSGGCEFDYFKHNDGAQTCREHVVSVISNQREGYPSILRASHTKDTELKAFEQTKRVVYVSDDNRNKKRDQVSFLVEKGSSDSRCHPSVCSLQNEKSENLNFGNGVKHIVVEPCNAESMASQNSLNKATVTVAPSLNHVMKNSYSVNDFSCCKVKSLDPSQNCKCGWKCNEDAVKVVEMGHPKEISNVEKITNMEISRAGNGNLSEKEMLNRTYSIERIPPSSVGFRRNYSNKSPRKNLKKEFKKIYVVDSINDSKEKMYSVEKRYDNPQQFREQYARNPNSIYRNTSTESLNFAPPCSFSEGGKNSPSNIKPQIFEYRKDARRSSKQATDTVLPPPPKPRLQCFSVHSASVPEVPNVSCFQNTKPSSIDLEEKTSSESFSYDTENLKQRIKDENLRLKREILSLRRAVNRGSENENNRVDLNVKEQNVILQHQIRILGKAIHDFAERLPDSDESGKLIEELAYQFNVSLDDLQKMNGMLRQKEKMFNTNIYTKNGGVDDNAQLPCMKRNSVEVPDDIRNGKHAFSKDKKHHNDGTPCLAIVDIYRSPIEADDIRHEMALVDDLIGQSQRIIAEATDTLWLTEYSIKTVLNEFFAVMEVNGESVAEIFKTPQGRQMYINELKKTVEKHLMSLFKTRTTMDKIQEQITNIKANAWNPNKNLPYCSCRPRRDILEDDIIHLMDRLHEAGNQACEIREKLLRVELSSLVSKAETIGRRENEYTGVKAVGNKNIQKLLDECQMLREKVLYLNHQLYLEKGKRNFESTTNGEQNVILANTGLPETYKSKPDVYRERNVDRGPNGSISGNTLLITKNDDPHRLKNVNHAIHQKVSDFKTTCNAIQENLNRIPDYSKEQKRSHNHLIQRMYDRLNYFKKTIERIESGINHSMDLRDVQGLSLEIQDLIQEIGRQGFDVNSNSSKNSLNTSNDCFKRNTYSQTLDRYS